MRTEPPHRLIRFRAVLLAIALLALAIGFVVLAAWKYEPPMPVWAKAVFAATTIAFVWFNGAFWWLELHYPHIESAAGKYVSRVERGSPFMQNYFWLLAAAYGATALLGTVSVLRLAAGG
jgi:hypothetical protein